MSLHNNANRVYSNFSAHIASSTTRIDSSWIVDENERRTINISWEEKVRFQHIFRIHHNNITMCPINRFQSNKYIRCMWNVSLWSERAATSARWLVLFFLARMWDRDTFSRVFICATCCVGREEEIHMKTFPVCIEMDVCFAHNMSKLELFPDKSAMHNDDVNDMIAVLVGVRVWTTRKRKTWRHFWSIYILRLQFWCQCSSALVLTLTRLYLQIHHLLRYLTQNSEWCACSSFNGKVCKFCANWFPIQKHFRIVYIISEVIFNSEIRISSADVIN